MGAALAQLLRSAAHICEDAEWHSRCCTEDAGCLCDAETHAPSAVERDIEVHSGCCSFEAHEGPNETEEVKDYDA